MIKVSENNISSNYIVKILKGSLISIIATIVLLVIFSIVLTYSNVNENTIPTVIIIITAISILIGSQITTSRIKKNGIVNGILVGLFYILFLYLISSSITRNFLLNRNAVIMILTSIFIGGLGGIIGVNRK